MAGSTVQIIFGLFPYFFSSFPYSFSQVGERPLLILINNYKCYEGFFLFTLSLKNLGHMTAYINIELIE